MEVDAEEYNRTQSPFTPGFAASVGWSAGQDESERLTSKAKEIFKSSKRVYRDKDLVALLGDIRSVQVIGFDNLIFTLYIITSKFVLRIKTMPRGIFQEETVPDLRAYNLWSNRWAPHIERLLNITLIHEAGAAEEYEAKLNTMLRDLHLNQNMKTLDPVELVMSQPQVTVQLPDEVNEHWRELKSSME